MCVKKSSHHLWVNGLPYVPAILGAVIFYTDIDLIFLSPHKVASNEIPAKKSRILIEEKSVVIFF